MRYLLLLLFVSCGWSVDQSLGGGVVLGAGPYVSTSSTPSGAAGGDLGGTYPNPTVVSVANVTTGVLPVPRGGTGLSSMTLGDLIYGASATTVAALAGNITTTPKYLTQTGSGAASTAPTWTSLGTFTGVTNSALTATRVIYSGSSGVEADDSGFTRTSLALTLDANTDNTVTTGYGMLGLASGGTSTAFYLAQASNYSSVSYALKQLAGGQTIINTKTGTNLALAVNNSIKWSMSSTLLTLSIPQSITDTTDSTSSVTGAQLVTGGLGVAKRSSLGTIATTFSGNIFAGVQDATAVAAGQVGEVLTGAQSTPTNFTTTNTIQNLTSISLTRGDWLETATMTLAMNAATEVAAAEAACYLNDTTASATGAVEGETIGYLYEPASASSVHATVTIIYHENISAAKTKFLNGKAVWTAGNPQYTCSMKAVRIR